MSQEGSPHFVVPDSIEPVLGWKAWLWNGGSLISPGYRQHWPIEEEMRALCAYPAWSEDPYHRRSMMNNHSAPDDRCRCGIYITGDIDEAARYGSILGKVYGWGKVIEYTRGWRVQYAYPAEIWIPDSWNVRFPLFVRELQRYGVPVRRQSALAHEARASIRRAEDHAVLFGKTMSLMPAAFRPTRKKSREEPS